MRELVVGRPDVSSEGGVLGARGAVQSGRVEQGRAGQPVKVKAGMELAAAADPLNFG